MEIVIIIEVAKPRKTSSPTKAILNQINENQDTLNTNGHEKKLTNWESEEDTEKADEKNKGKKKEKTFELFNWNIYLTFFHKIVFHGH